MKSNLRVINPWLWLASPETTQGSKRFPLFRAKTDKVLLQLNYTSNKIRKVKEFFAYNELESMTFANETVPNYPMNLVINHVCNFQPKNNKSMLL